MKSDTIICFIFEDEDKRSEIFEYLNKMSNNELEKQLFEYKMMTGKFQETFKYAINSELKVIKELYSILYNFSPSNK